VPFRYEEHGEVKNELVKVRVCTDCARKLFYKKTKEVQRMAKKKRTDAQGAEEMLLSLPERETLREESPGVQAQPSEQFVGAVAQAPDVERKKWIEPPAKEKTADERMDEYLSDLFM
jgi:protein FRA10AC1